MKGHAPESTREQISGILLSKRDSKDSDADKLVEGEGWGDWISEDLDE